MLGHKSYRPNTGLNPTVVIPQVWNPLVLMDEKEPAGAVTWSYSLEPQQTTVPSSALIPHMWFVAALIEEKMPLGGMAKPEMLPESSLEPQHTTEPSTFMPQVWWCPALTEEND